MNENWCYGHPEGWRHAFTADRHQHFQCDECGKRFDRLTTGRVLPNHEQAADHA